MKTSILLWGAVVVSVSLTPFLSNAGSPGGYDSSFSTAVANGPVFAVGTTSGGYVWMGGYFNSVNGSYHASEYNVSTSDTYFDVAVLNTNGGLTTGITFPSYANTLMTEVNSGGGFVYYYVGAMAVDANDVVFVAFNSQRGQYSVIAQFDPAGPGAWTFNPGFAAATSNMFNTVYSLAADGTNVYVAGSGTLAKLNYSGGNTGYAPPPGLTTYYNSYIYQVRYLPMSAGFTNNSLLICGGFGVARISTTGTNIYQQNTPSGGQLWCAATRSDAQQAACPNPQGELIAGGDGSPFTAEFYESPATVDGFLLSRYGSNTVTSLITNTAGDNFSICRVDAGAGGDMVLCGDFNEINGSSARGFAHLLADGTVDTSFYNSTGIEPFDMAKQSDGKIVLGGSAEYTDSQVFGDEQGYVERHYGLPAGTNTVPDITEEPEPTNQDVFVGDSVYYYTAVSSPYGYLPQWTHNGTNLPGQEGTTLSFTVASTNDAGVYQMAVQSLSLCGGTAYSSNVYLTVSPPPPAPPNDDFANAYLLEGLNVTTNGYVRSSTFEPGEQDPTGNDDQMSVWYSWTAPTNCTVTLDLSGSDFPAAVGIYTGTEVDALTLITNNCYEVSDGEGGFYCDGLNQTTVFTAMAGTTYQIQIGGQPYAGSLGDINLSLYAAPIVPPAPYATSWQSVYSNASLVFYSVAAGGGSAVAGGYVSSGDYSQIVANTCTLTNWTVQDPGLEDIEQVTYSRDRYFIGGEAMLAESTNSVTWFSNYLAGLNLSQDIYLEATAFAVGNYVAVGANGVVLTSPDALTWAMTATNITYASDDYLEDVTYGNGLFVAVGDDCSVVTSPDGTNWTLSASQIGAEEGDSLYSVAFGNGMFVAVGYGTGVVTSYDGTNWFSQNSPTADGGIVAYGAGLFVQVNGTSNLWVSPDGTNWFKDVSGVQAQLYDVTYCKNGQFLVVGSQGTILLNQPPTFSAVTQTNGGAVMTLVGLSGATAVVESTPSLRPACWQPVYTNTIVNGMVTYTNNPALPAQFFRAVVH